MQYFGSTIGDYVLQRYSCSYIVTVVIDKINGLCLFFVSLNVTYDEIMKLYEQCYCQEIKTIIYF